MPECTVTYSATSGAKVTLPPVTGGGPVTVSLDSGVIQVVTADGSTINGITGSTGVTVSAETEVTVFYSNGTDWFILAGGPTAVVDTEVIAITAATTAVAGAFYVDSPSSAHTVSLPLLAAGGPVTVKNLTGSYTVTVKTTDGSTIDGVAGTTGFSLPHQYDTATFVTDGVEWYVESSQLDTPI
jgi:hypothetical protein